jgi:hypothetical protein
MVGRLAIHWDHCLAVLKDCLWALWMDCRWADLMGQPMVPQIDGQMVIV